MMSRHAHGDRDDWIVIGVSGVTCGGKTTLSSRLLHSLTPVYSFEQDKYFYPDDSPHHVRCDGLEHNNYDILSALDMRQMFNDVVSTMKGRDRSHARFTSRQPGRLELPGKRVLIVEGFSVLNYRPIYEMCDLRYYLVLEYEECLNRRLLRLYDPPDVPGYFEQCVWPEHVKYRAEIESDPNVKVLDGAQPNVFDILMTDLQALGMSKIE